MMNPSYFQGDTAGRVGGGRWEDSAHLRAPLNCLARDGAISICRSIIRQSSYAACRARRRSLSRSRRGVRQQAERFT